MSPKYKQRVISVLEGLKKGDINAMQHKKVWKEFRQLRGYWDRKFGQSRSSDKCGFLKECIRLLDETDRFSLFVPRNICKAFPGDSSGMSCYNKLCKLKHQWIASY
jgi:hypothetical protein